MADPGGLQLSIAESLVLCLLCEEPTYGQVLTGLLAPEGRIGQVWWVPKSMVYRALPRLERAGLIRATGQQRSGRGPDRSLYEATVAGQLAAREWLRTPAEHARDVRSELMVKLALLDRTGADPRELLQAQIARLLPVAAALEDRLRTTTGFEHVLTLYRHESVSGTLRVLHALTSPLARP
jgi:DNA-binding PadR family transcriptional regulator